MMSDGCVFVLPLESDQEDDLLMSDESILLHVDSDNKNYDPKSLNQGQIERRPAAKKSSRFSLIRFTWRMIKWHILLFLVLSSSIYAILHFCFDKKQKEIILTASAFFNDWRLLVFFFGIYLSFSIKKIGDVSSVRNWLKILSLTIEVNRILTFQHIPPTDKIANLVSVAIRKHVRHNFYSRPSGWRPFPLVSLNFLFSRGKFYSKQTNEILRLLWFVNFWSSFISDIMKKSNSYHRA